MRAIDDPVTFWHSTRSGTPHAFSSPARIYIADANLRIPGRQSPLRRGSMKSVILFALPDDHSRVRNIVGALNESNLDVYWDRTDPASNAWEDSVDAARSSRAVVFFFSSQATDESAKAYIDLADECIRSDKALCVLLDDVDLGSSLAGCTTYDLRGWRSRASSLFMLDLIAGVKAKAAGLDPPSPRAARQLLIQRLYIAVPSAIAALALGVGLYRDLGADKIASPAEATAWAAVHPNSCDDLRRFLSEHGTGVHAAEVQALLAARRTVSRQVTTSAKRPLPLYVSALGAPVSQSNAAASATADERAKGEAERLCRGLADATSSAFRSALPNVTDRQCEAVDGGFSCSVGGDAICQLDESEVKSVEVCGRAS